MWLSALCKFSSGLATNLGLATRPPGCTVPGLLTLPDIKPDINMEQIRCVGWITMHSTGLTLVGTHFDWEVISRVKVETLDHSVSRPSLRYL